jgi:hypothetical protein
MPIVPARPAFPIGAGVLLTLAVSGLAVAGCARIERSQRCAAVIDVVNPALKQIEPLARKKPTSQITAKLSERYRLLAKDLKKISLPQSEFKQDVTHYAEALDQVAQSLEQSAKELSAAKDRGSKESKKSALRKRELGQFKQRADTFNGQINQYCSKP